MVSILPILHVIGLLLSGLGLAMLLPAVADAYVGNPDWRSFVASAAVTWTFGFLLAISTHRPGPVKLTVRDAFVMTALVWITLAAFSALPLLGIGLSYGDAFFEAVSGFTTTGSTVISGLDRLPPGVLLWRALLQWMGGLGLIVMAIIILPFLRVGGMQLFHTESSDRSEKVVPRAGELVRYLATAYGLLTLACATAYGLAGMKPFDAICHAMTTLSTGGFANYDASFGGFEPAAIHWIAVIFMLAGAVPFVLYIRLVKGERSAFLADVQVRALLVFVAAVSAGLGIWLSLTQHLPVLEGLRLAAFNVVSVVTTTGYANADYNGWGPPAVAIFLMLMFVGGCTGSTSGAIKIYRFQVLFLVVRAHLRRLARPSRIVALRYGGRRVPDDVPVSVLAFVAVYLGTITVFTVVLGAMGLDLVTAFTSSVQAIGNVGPGLGEIVGPAGNFSTVPDEAKWVLAAAMLLGRLELFTLLVMLDPEFWRG